MVDEDCLALPTPRTEDQLQGGVLRHWRRIVFVLVVPLAAGCPAPSTPEPSATDVALQLVAEGFVSPVGMVAANDGSERLFILDQVGQVRIIGADGELRENPFLDVSSKLPQLNAGFDERGLLGLAFHPDYRTNGRFFVRYSAPRAGDPSESCNDPAGFIVGCHSEILSEFRVSDTNPDAADPESEVILLSVEKPQFNHNSGQIAFGPDGRLYVGFGDGGGANDNETGHSPGLGNGQDKSTLSGKILRIDVDAGNPYAVPPDNPFVGEEGSRTEIWAFGLRNPWRFSFDAGGERRLFVGDAGQDIFEEVDIIERGENYGWHIKEGTHCFSPVEPGSPPATCPNVDADGNPLVDPIIEYSHLIEDGEPFGVVVIGGYVYRGSALSKLQGQYIFGDYSSGFTEPDGRLFAGVEAADGSWTMRELSVAGTANGRPGRFILGFGQDNGGEVYVLTTQVVGPNGTTGSVYKLVPPS